MRIAFILAASAAALTLAGCGSAAASDPLRGTTWQLTSIESMASPGESGTAQPNTTISDPTKYTVTFGDDGNAAFQVDCNRGTSSWKAESAGPDSGTLTFGPIGLTRMFCPQPSDDTKVAAALGQVRSYLISDGKLHLSLQADSGIMHWQPKPAG